MADTTTVPAAAPPRDGDAPTRRGAPGWTAVARKELADHLRSVRFLILVALLAIAGVAAVAAAASGIREVASDASGTPALFLRLFTLAPERVPPFLALIGFMGPLLGIAFGFDAVNGERAQRTLPRLLSQPIHRDDVVNGKFVAGLTVIALTLTALVVFVAGVGLFRLGIVPSAGEVVRMLAYLVVAILYVGFWLALATLASVVLARAATSALATIAAWLVLTFFFGLLVGIAADALNPAPAGATPAEVVANAETVQSLSRLSPTTLYQEATTALLNPEVRALGFLLPVQLDRAIPSALPVGQSLLLVWPQVVGLLAGTVVVFALAYVAFMRQEVRA